MAKSAATPLQPAKSRRPSGRRRHPVLRVFLTVLLVIAVALVGVGGYYLAKVTTSLNSMQRDPSALPTNSDRPPVGQQGAMNIALMGTDTRGQEQGRSDTLLIMHISADRKNVYLVSFPRDSYVAIPGYGKAKINAAYSWGGSALAVQTLESLLNVRIDHVAQIDFENFVKLVDVVGGVTVYNKYASGSNGYTFPKGQITLDGDEALTYVRERYTLPNGDLDRAERQRDVIRALIVKVATPEVLANPQKVTQLIDSLSQYVTVDSSFTTQEELALALSMRISGSSSIHLLQAPIEGFDTTADGQSIDVVDPKKWKELGQALSSDTMEEYVATHPS